MYYCIQLSEETKNKVLGVFNTFFTIPEGWEVHCNHITLIHNSHENWNVIADLLMNFIGDYKKFKIVGVGQSKYAMALAVDTHTVNSRSHITIAVAPDHKPSESNNIHNWERLYCTEEFEGRVQLNP